MIKTLLADRNPAELDRIRKIIQDYCHRIQVVACCMDAATVKRAVVAAKPDLILMDVDMPGKNGFDLLKELHPVSFEVIFMGGQERHVLKAFQYDALGYIIKPFTGELLIETLNRVSERILNARLKLNRTIASNRLHKSVAGGEMKLCVPSLKGFRVVSLDDILYCEAETSYTRFYLSDGKQLLASRPILEYETALQNNFFCRVHKSFLVNMSHIKEYQRGEGGTVILSNRTEVEVSRRRKDSLINKMKKLYKY